MNPILKNIYDICPVSFQNVLLNGYSALLDRQRYGGEYKKYRKFMDECQWYNESDLLKMQEDKLRLLIKHAYNTVPYYREQFNRRKLTPNDIKGIQDLQKLPLLTRKDIKANFKKLLSKDFPKNKIKYGHTSGTTGTPLEVAYDHHITYATYAALDRHYHWAGVKLSKNGDRVAVLRGNVIVPLSQINGPFWRYNHVHNQLLLSTFHLSAQNLPLYLREVEKYRPVVFDGYPSTLYVFAKFLQNERLTLPVKAVISSSETLYDFQRAVIEKSFQCPVSDYYALAERVVFASECEKHEGHHIYMDYGITEIINHQDEPVQKGQPGKLVGTSLYNFAMPLIRYVTNDMTAIQNRKCACGRSLQLMEDVTTKAEDSLTLRDGRIISPSVLTHPFKPMDCVEASQIIQKEYDRIIIKIVPGQNYTDSDAEHLIIEMKLRLGKDMTVDIEIANELERTKSGKFRWVVSEIPLGI